MLRLNEVSYRIPEPRNLVLLKKVSFAAQEKEHSIIYGDNGAGKTTLLRIMLKLIQPRSGRVISPSEGVSAVFEDIESQLIFSTVKEELESSAGSVSEDRITELLGIGEIKGRNTTELSYSEKARVILAAAYLSGKEYIFLDSPPADKKIDEAISAMAAKNLRTLILFMPWGDKRKYRGNWKPYLLENSVLTANNGN